MMIRRAAALRIAPIMDPANRCGRYGRLDFEGEGLNIRLGLMPEVLALRRINTWKPQRKLHLRGEASMCSSEQEEAKTENRFRVTRGASIRAPSASLPRSDSR
jgi:hypothetical protein